MPRAILTSNWEERPDLTNSWNVERDILDILGITFDTQQVTFDSTTDYTFDQTGSLAKSIRDWDERDEKSSSWSSGRNIGLSEWSQERYDEIFRNNIGNIILNNEGNTILLNGINETNVLSSNWN